MHIKDKHNHPQPNNRSVDTWRVWDKAPDYGQLFFDRAKGHSPEMESSMAAARILQSRITSESTLLDVGCGAGHYLRSLRRLINEPFRYTGLDATESYINLANQAWADDAAADFVLGDIYNLPFEDNAFDTVLCCNVFLHLPSIQQPLHELIRVARGSVLIRTLVGDRSFRIQDVFSPSTHPERFSGSDDIEFDTNGEPKAFSYLNIYSKLYIGKLLEQERKVKSFSITSDQDFNPERLRQDSEARQNVVNITRLVGGFQINGAILQPWHFIQIELDH